MSAAPILVRNRRTGALEEEVVLGERFLRAVYERPFASWLRRALLVRPVFSKLYGVYQQSHWSQPSIERAVRTLSLDLSDFVVPSGGFRSFNDFFTRRLRPGARPLDPDPASLLSPADARLLAFPVQPQGVFPVKGHSVSLERLLASKQDALAFIGGWLLVFRLCPSDYHRFHFPCAGTSSAARLLEGPLESVNPLALATGRPILDTNQRALSFLSSARFGRLAYLEVGALCVGSIVQTYSPGAVSAGDEKGYFQFGGSTVVVALEPGRVTLDDDLLSSSCQGVETLVRMGERIGRAALPG